MTSDETAIDTGQKYCVYDSAFAEAITTEEIRDMECVSGQKDPSVHEYDAEVWFAETNSTSAYIIDVGLEKSYATDLDRGDSRCGTRTSRLTDTYKCAMRLGTFVPTVVFGDDIWVLKSFDGVKPYEMTKEEYINTREKIDMDSLLWDFARLYILGYRDSSIHNLLLAETGEFRHIDMQCADQRVHVKPDIFMKWISEKFIALGLQPEQYRTFELRTLALIHHIEETGVLEPWVTDTIRENMRALQELLPLHDSGTVPRSELPDVTESVIPSTTPWS